MKSTGNSVLVRRPKSGRWKNKITAPGGMEFYTTPNNKYEAQDIAYWGEVYAAPDQLKNGDPCDVKVGDKVYFQYTAFFNKPVMDDDIYQMDYDLIFCRVRDKEITAVGRWVLLKPLEMKESMGVLINPFTTMSKNVSEVCFISPRVELKTEDGDIERGDFVMIDGERAAFENEIEGEKYYCTRYHNIQMLWQSETLVK